MRIPPLLRLGFTSAVLFATAFQAGAAPLSVSAHEQQREGVFRPDQLVVSRSVYVGTPDTVKVGQLLPPNCPSTAKCGGSGNKGVPAIASGAFPALNSANNVWDNDTVDASFGVTSPIFLDEMTRNGRVTHTLAIDPARITTSFSSKSELALNLSTDGSAITFMGYVTPVNTLDASNANTPGVVDPTNPVGENVYRALAQVDGAGRLELTSTNAYSGNNGRAAILSHGLYYAVGNDNNGSTTAANLINSTGAELIVPGATPGTPQMIGNFSVTQYGFPADKPGKDNNFRGLTIHDNTLYVTKGSGGNGINTVYQVGSAGVLPDQTTAASAPITILPGFPTTLAKASNAQHPFGIFFADDNTLYVADEGDGVAADAATSPDAGLQKWVRSNGVWQRVYVLQKGLNLGQPYSVPGYPAALNPAPDGLRNITGRVSEDGTVEIWAVTSTVSANGDQGADPNQLVFIKDRLRNTDPARAADEHFDLLRTAGYAEVLRGVSFTPGSHLDRDDGNSERGERHVLLLSVDGLHASDLQQWIDTHPTSQLARLSRIGTTYTNAASSRPSDSFPGLLAQLTGGTPKSTGVFYDDSYDRSMWAPGSNCQGPAGTEAVYAENLDRTDASGNIPLFTSIDPANLPMGMVDGKCVPIYPHSFLKTNTIFNVAHNAGLYTAWSDKHPAYEIVRGPANTGADDLFTPEINNVNDPTGVSVAATDAYDQLKVRAILNQIDGKTSDGSKSALVPAIFGMNFQSVSVGEKLVDPVKSCFRNTTGTCDPSYVPGGYEPKSLAFTPQMLTAMSYVDGAIGSMVDELGRRELLDSTELIVSAKHGQSPIDPSTLHKIGDQVSNVLSSAGVGIAQNTTDDIALVWLKDQNQTGAAVAALDANRNGSNSARIQFVLSGDPLADQFGDPRTNTRTPDLIVQPIPGTIYTNSKAKVAEHGGFDTDDTHVALLVVQPGRGSDRFADDDRDGERITASVHTTQIAPTILHFLGLNPRELDAVRAEHTDVLPDSDF